MKNRTQVIWYTLGSGMMAGSTVLLTMLTGHWCDLTQVGILTFALTVSQILYALALFGANDFQITDVDHRFLFSDYFWLKCCSTILATLACAGILFVLRMEREARICTIILTGFMLLNSLAELYQSMFFQNHRLDLAGKAMFSHYALATVAFAAAILLSGSLVVSCLVMMLTNGVVIAFWVFFRADEFRDSPCGKPSEKVFQLGKQTMPLCLGILISLVIINYPKFLINQYLSEAQQGSYGILFMPTYALNLLGQCVFKPFLHRYAERWGRGTGVFLQFLFGQMGLFAVFSCAGAVFMYFAGPFILFILFGQNIYQYRFLLAGFVLAGGLLAINQQMYYILIILKKQRAVAANYITALLLTIVSGIVLTQFSDHFGAFNLWSSWYVFMCGQISLLIGYLLTILHETQQRV